jgi:hypothetical protein
MSLKVACWTQNIAFFLSFFYWKSVKEPITYKYEHETDETEKPQSMVRGHRWVLRCHWQRNPHPHHLCNWISSLIIALRGVRHCAETSIMSNIFIYRYETSFLAQKVFKKTRKKKFLWHDLFTVDSIFCFDSPMMIRPFQEGTDDNFLLSINR